MLEVQSLDVSYGGVQAVSDLSFAVSPGTVVGLVGANGAGKTSTLNAMSGLVDYGGRITMDGSDLKKMSTAEIVDAGLVQVAQGRQLFPDMTVLENLEMGGFLQSRAEMRAQVDEMMDRFEILRSRAGQRAVTLSGGEQQMLAVARALMAKPRTLLVDEPCLGLAPMMVDQLAVLIRQVNEMGITILLVEQNTAFVFGLASHAHVLENGRLALSGTPEELKQNDKVRSAYLGI